jgi:transcriptional regulator with XRE-family HTH domain
MIDLNEISTTIREHRKKLGLTQRELAQEARVSRALIAELESGRLPELGIRKLMRILHAVGLDLRLTSFNLKRPTLEDLLEDEETEAK